MTTFGEYYGIITAVNWALAQFNPAFGVAGAADAAPCACYTRSTRLRPASAASAAGKPLLRFPDMYHNRRESSFAVFGRGLQRIGGKAVRFKGALERNG